MEANIIMFVLKLFAFMIIGLLSLILLYVLIGAFIETIHDDYVRMNSNASRGKPRAKCYCCDCEFYNIDTHLCKMHGYARYSVDNFCKDASPVAFNRFTEEKRIE